MHQKLNGKSNQLSCDRLLKLPILNHNPDVPIVTLQHLIVNGEDTLPASYTPGGEAQLRTCACCGEQCCHSPPHQRDFKNCFMDSVGPESVQNVGPLWHSFLACWAPRPVGPDGNSFVWNGKLYAEALFMHTCCSSDHQKMLHVNVIISTKQSILNQAAS
jgi:hypothetical protein